MVRLSKIIFVFCFLCSTCVYAQADYTRNYISPDTTVFLHGCYAVNNRGMEYSPLISYDGVNEFNVVSFPGSLGIVDTVLTVYRCNIQDYKTTSSTYVLPQSVPDSSYYFNGIYAQKDKVLFYMNKWYKQKRYVKMLVYDKQTSKLLHTFDFVEQLKNIRYMLSLPSGEALICSGYVGFHKLKDKFITLAIFDINTGQIKYETHLALPYAGLSLCQVNKQVAVTDSSILFTELGNYKIHEFDFELREIGTIGRTDNWSTFPMKVMKKAMKKYREPIERIYALMGYWDKYSRIFRIYADEDKLYVWYKKPDINYGTVDIWKKKNGTWSLYKNNIEDKTDYKDAKSVRVNTVGFTSRFLLFKGDKIYRFNYNVPLSLFQVRDMSSNELDEFRENYLLENEDVLLLDVFNNNF